MSEEGIGYSEKIHIDDLLERMAAENIPMKYVQHYARQNGADCGFIGVETLVPGTTVTQLRQLTAQACTESTTMKDHFFTNQRIALRSSKAIRSDVTRVKKLISKAYMAGKWLENAGLALLVKKLNGTLKKSVRVISCTDKQNYTLYDGSIDTVPGHSIQTADQLVDLLKSDDVYGILVNKGNYHWVATVKVARATLADGRRRSLRLHAAPSGAPMPSPLTSPPPQPEAPGSSRQRGPSTTPPPSPPCGPPGDDKYLPDGAPEVPWHSAPSGARRWLDAWIREHEARLEDPRRLSCSIGLMCGQRQWRLADLRGLDDAVCLRSLPGRAWSAINKVNHET